LHGGMLQCIKSIDGIPHRQADYFCENPFAVLRITTRREIFMRKQIAMAALIGSAALGLSVPVQAQDMSKIRYLAANCANCHGTDGRSVGIMESLAGYDKEKFISNMKEYRSGDKPATLMHQIVKGYTDEQIADLAAYFAAQPKKK
jgi:sulfide dehydrogenase cytochrome subunit